MNRHWYYLLVAIISPLLLAACQASTSKESRVTMSSEEMTQMTPEKFRELSIEKRHAYCETRVASTEHAKCMAMAGDAEGAEFTQQFPVDVSEEQIKQAFEQCRKETGMSASQDLASCAASLLSQGRSPGTAGGYTARQLERAQLHCEQAVASPEIELCISETLPRIAEQDRAKSAGQDNE